MVLDGKGPVECHLHDVLCAEELSISNFGCFWGCTVRLVAAKRSPTDRHAQARAQTSENGLAAAASES